MKRIEKYLIVFLSLANIAAFFIDAMSPFRSVLFVLLMVFAFYVYEYKKNK